MECNKDEALRAKQIAISKMQSGDFEGGNKFALKAKNMYAEVENIAQILTVCEVHISAKNRLSGGSDLDWYGILRTGQLADEATITKQYRKLALLLHPDKNKFAGAEAAFKLIGEANRVLGNKANRSLYDMKYKVSVRPRATKTSSHHSNGNAFAAKHDGNGTRYQNNSFSHSTFSNAHQQPEPQIFWTSCKHCNAKCQCTKNTLNATLLCPRCLNSFSTSDIPSVFPRASFGTKNWKEASKGGAPKPSSKSNGGGHKDNFVRASMKKGAGAGVGGHHKGKETGRTKGTVLASKVAKEMGSRSTTNVGSKRVRQSAPDSRQKPHELKSPPKKPRQNESFNTNQFDKRKEPVSGGLSINNNTASKECRGTEAREWSAVKVKGSGFKQSKECGETEAKRRSRVEGVKRSGVGNSKKCGGTEVRKEAEQKILKVVGELKLMETIKELKLKLDVLESKLNETRVTTNNIKVNRGEKVKQSMDKNLAR